MQSHIISFKVGKNGFAQIIDTSGRQIIHLLHELEGMIQKSEHHTIMLANQEGVEIGKQEQPLFMLTP